ncbi:L-fucose mutarotase [Polystyrenella longa]|uniref:L-fucose mutarotase n=1 Tax=Polystyrenella longa TaxID=2528007 RepID=A0A518CKL2_9PLAN|nr:RbsD/FucU domain-containing protein [Polystyrenella longa]QDU79724.1 L-fucose mutarotase [Polystyrenella longa]
MLKGVPNLITPELMDVLMKMGHGDELVIADGNFPADSHAQRIVRADGHGVPAVLDAVLKFLPLDTFVAQPAGVMQPVDENTPEPTIWKDFRRVIETNEGEKKELELIERFAFYDRAKAAYAVIATSETALYANIIIKKGVVVE